MIDTELGYKKICFSRRRKWKY